MALTHWQEQALRWEADREARRIREGWEFLGQLSLPRDIDCRTCGGPFARGRHRTDLEGLPVEVRCVQGHRWIYDLRDGSLREANPR